MSYVFEGFMPKGVWQHFYDINQIPRCSRNEDGVRKHIKNLAEKLNLKYKEDETGNIVIKKDASPGMENKPIVVIQGHMDMVCEKNEGTDHDFTKDPIKMIKDGEWIKADGTTLGSDNAIGLSMGLNFLTDNSLVHPPLEILATVDEETGLNGAVGIKDNWLDGRILLNLDTEEEDVLCIGCAGGIDTIMNRKIDWQPVPAGQKAYLLKIKGLRGGHSGTDINKQFGNALKLLARILFKFSTRNSFNLAAINGGSAHNAIPREAEAILVLSEAAKNELQKLCKEFQATFNNELSSVESGIVLLLDEKSGVKQVFSSSLTSSLVKFLYTIPHGVMAMSQQIEGLVETSTNMAVMKTKQDKLYLQTSQRSSVASAIVDIADKVRAIGELAGFTVEQEGGYPSWQPDFNSSLLAACKKAYKKQFGKDAVIEVIHAGLECGIIGGKHPGMDMISFGPDITGAHSPAEKVRIKSVENVWKYLLEVLKSL